MPPAATPLPLSDYVCCHAAYCHFCFCQLADMPGHDIATSHASAYAPLAADMPLPLPQQRYFCFIDSALAADTTLDYFSPDIFMPGHYEAPLMLMKLCRHATLSRYAIAAR
jgi:hypothetical protein